MTGIRNILAIFTSMVVLSACGIASEIETVRTMRTANPTLFTTALHAEYSGVAKSEDDEGDTDNARYFLGKAKMVAEGKKVGPQPIKERSLPGDTGAELEAARIALVAALGATGTQKAPKHAAHAQVMFDCWMEEQHENHQPKDIAACRAAFNKALAAVEKALIPPMVAAKPMPAPMSPIPGPYTVFFAFDHSELDGAGWDVVAEAASKAIPAKVKRIYLNGHADRSGASPYNMSLSKARVAAVASALDNLGLSLEMIISSHLGEEFPVVPTPDGKREAENRRVDIKFQR